MSIYGIVVVSLLSGLMLKCVDVLSDSDSSVLVFGCMRIWILLLLIVLWK